ncbi:MAG TPA: hypothetical protein VKX49_00335 [Bryobacteraceae bacterium]|jgi:hypothetical protein|nr:hypothetical protein [Bryobacteraceae bacterium]
MNDHFENLKRQVEDEMDLEAIRDAEYMAVLAEEIAHEVRQQARKEAGEEIRRRRIEEDI